jgi:hypothetical protein
MTPGTLAELSWLFACEAWAVECESGDPEADRLRAIGDELYELSLEKVNEP